MVGTGLLAVAGVFLGLWLITLVLFRRRVPAVQVVAGQTEVIWVFAPAGIACLLVAGVIVPWEWLGSGPGDESGPYIVGSVGVVAWGVSRWWPVEWYLDPNSWASMRRLYVVVAGLAVALIASGPFIPD